MAALLRDGEADVAHLQHVRLRHANVRESSHRTYTVGKGFRRTSFQWPPFSGPPVGPAHSAIFVLSATFLMTEAKVAWMSPQVRQRLASLPIQSPQPVGSSQDSTESTIGNPRRLEQASMAERNLIHDVLICG